MSTFPPHILALAETMELHLPQAVGTERIIERRFAAFFGVKPDLHRDMVQRLRLSPDEVEPTVLELRALYRARGRTAMRWEVGPSCTPPDLVSRLSALGMVPYRGIPELCGMVLAEPPQDTVTSLEVRRVERLADYRTLRLVYHRCFGQGEPAPTDEDIADDFERRRGPQRRMYLALDAGEVVASAESFDVEGAVALIGGATLPEARGKGAYRALVDARWKDAVARGTPVLVVQAGPMSRPILERLGFRAVTRVQVLADRFA